MRLGKFLLELNNFFTIYRWNNRPGILKFTEADNAFHSLILYSYIFKDIKKKDFIKLIKNKIVKELPKLILSDISLDIKTKVQEKDKDIWSKLIKKTYGEFNNYFDKKFINEFFEYKTFDNNIINTEKLISLYVSEKELEINNRVFSEYYGLPKREIEDNIKSLNSSYKKELISVKDDFLKVTLRLNTMTRWNKNHRHIKNTVSSHTFYVLVVSMIIATIDKVDEKIFFDIIMSSLLHDLPEAFTGDVITPTKRKVEGLENIITDIENDFIDNWANDNIKIKKYIEKNKKYIINPFSNKYGQYVRTADLLAALNECAIEIISGNQNNVFRKAFFSIKKDIKLISPIDVSDILDEIEYETF